MHLWAVISGAALLIAHSRLVHAQTSDNAQLIAALQSHGVNTQDLPGNTPKSSSSHCALACKVLAEFRSNSTLLQGTSQYSSWTSLFWSQQQEETRPGCVFQAPSANDVAAALLLARITQCQFSVKSGGHAAFKGASSIDKGLSIDLVHLNQITVAQDRKSVTVGPGNKWLDVYQNLDPQGLAVIGGRVSAIGVGGLTLGGGISFFSNIYGWACDNVQSYEVVCADGRIRTVSPTQNADLYWALRGGGNNFGIVTSFKVNAFEHGLMWGGNRVSLLDQSRNASLEAFVNFGHNSPQDPNAALILAVAYAQTQDIYIISTSLEYTKPIENPPFFNNFTSIPAIVTTTQIRTLANVTEEFAQSNPDGLRETYWAATFKLDLRMLNFITDVFLEETKPIEAVPGIVPALVLQVITEGQLQQMSKNGGNPLGLSAKDGPLILLNLAYMWSKSADDKQVLQANQNIVKRTVAQSQKWGLNSDYLYMNYASQFQDVIGSYGLPNVRRLKQIAKKYDPSGVFQTLQPGYFKLNGAPAAL